MSNKTYRGYLDDRRVRYAFPGGQRVPSYEIDVRTVTVDGIPLPLHREVIDYWDKFEWCSGGSRGEYQLATAILTDAFGADTAKRYITQFAREVVRKLKDQWTLTEADVFAAVLDYEQENRNAPRVAIDEVNVPVHPAVASACALPTIARPRRSRRRKSAPPPSPSQGGAVSAIMV
jgi:hypothetical protein